MGKHTEKRNIHTFTIRMSFVKFWNIWVKTLPRQEEFSRLKYKENAGLISVAICKLIVDNLYDFKDKLTKKELEDLEKAEEFADRILLRERTLEEVNETSN